MAQSYTWAGGNAGVWSDPANWTDVTNGPVPATVAPGSSDNVVLDGWYHLAAGGQRAGPGRPDHAV